MAKEYFCDTCHESKHLDEMACTDAEICEECHEKWFQEQGVVPWMRQRVPLLYCGDDLVAIGDLWQSADRDAEMDEVWRVTWRDRPTLS